MKKPTLPAISKVKKVLYADWALRVKQADGWKCLLCGSEDNLTAHHWLVCDHHAHAARYCVHNGATLCYACHIRGVHQRADWTSVNAVAEKVLARPGYESSMTSTLSKVELTVPVLRRLWDAMRARPVVVGGVIDVRFADKKIFLNTHRSRQIAVVGNTICEPVLGEIMEVAVVTKTDDGYRYTLKPIQEVGE